MEELKESKKIQNTITNTTNNTNSNNRFNLNLFLNEQCKDALNLNDFINSLKVTVEDLERTGKLGYVEGISNIFLNGLRELDIYTRPIHCTDLKRETVYVKDKDKWEKETEDKSKLKQAVKQIATKNLKQLKTWQLENPEFSNFDSKENEQYMIISKSSLGGYDKEEDEKYQENIIKNVLKETKVPS
jgi:ABC-type lipoprotein release transport system permease subunit